MCANNNKNQSNTKRIEVASFQRVGLGNKITEQEWIGNKDATQASKGIRLNPTIDVGIRLDLNEAEIPQSSSEYMEKTISLTGPYEVKGLNPNAIIRVFPPDKDVSFENNHLPYIEFAEPDLPWRYTPAGHKNNKLTPWISLIACKSNEFTIARNKEGTLIATIKKNAWETIFGDAYQDAPHLWAHVEKTTGEPFSRLLCPRKLEENTAYTVLLIPTYELSRLSGLGFRLPETPTNANQPIEKDTPFDIPVQTRSWATDATKQEARERGFAFPVYYSWHFQTSTGDFYTLAKRLKAISTNSLPKDVEVDVSKMGVGLDYDNLNAPPQDKSVGIAMASMPISYNQINFPKYGSELADRIQTLLSKSQIFVENKDLLNNTNEESTPANEDPWVVPPLYGARHALAESLNDDCGDNSHPWFYELNTQVPNRIAAGLGAEVIKQNQEQLVQRAWEQVSEVIELNQKIREKFFGISTGKDLYYNKVSGLRKEELKERLKGESRNETINLLIQLLLNLSVSLDIPLNNMLEEDKNTLAKLLKKSNFPTELINPSIQKLLRSFNRVGNDTTNGTEVSLIRTMLENQSGIFNLDKLQIILNYKVEDLVRKIQENLDYYRRAAIRESLEMLHFMCHYWVEALGLHGSESNDNSTNDKSTHNLQDLLPNEGWIKRDVKKHASKLNLVSLKLILGKREQYDRFFKAMPYKEEVTFSEFYNLYFKKYIESNNKLITLYDQYDALLAKIARQTDEPQVQKHEPIDWEELASGILDIVQETMTNKNIKLKEAIINYLEASHVVIPEYNDDSFEDTKNRIVHQNPILAYPYFAEPTYYYLNKLSSKYILPAIDDLPDNTISLFKDNKKFIESYICGLNTEMGKELFWREYPTDRRGSYFEKFWDSENFHSNNSYIPDVEPQYNWYRSLGDNHSDTEPLLIFVVKGELMKKYPDALVYLTPSIIKEKVEFTDQNPILPELKARIAKDTTLYGFKIGFKKLLAGPGHFLAFKERPGKFSFTNLVNTESIDSFENSADFATKKVAQPCIYAKHISTLLSK